MNAYEPSTRSPETARASVGGGRKRFEFQKEVDMAQRRAANERECERLAVLAVYRAAGRNQARDTPANLAPTDQAGERRPRPAWPVMLGQARTPGDRRWAG